MAHELSLIQSLRLLLPLVPRSQWVAFGSLLVLALFMAVMELALAGLVAMMAATMSSPEVVLNHESLLLLQSRFGLFAFTDARLLLFVLLCAIFAAVVMKSVFSLLQLRLTTAFSDGVSNNFREYLLRFYLRAPYLWLLHAGSTELLFGFRIAANLGATLTLGLQFFSNAIMLSVILVGLVAASPFFMLIFLGVLIAGCLLLVRGVRRLLDERSQKVFAAERDLHAVQQLSVNGLKEMRLYGREEALLKSYVGRLWCWLVARKAQQSAMRLPVISLELLGFSTLCLILGILYFIQDASMARISGVMGLLAAAAWRCLPVANRLLESFTGLRVSLPALAQSAKTINQEAALRDQLALPIGSISEPVSFETEVRLDEASLCYPGSSRLALDTVSLSIKPKQLVGIIGLSGAGKSSLVNVLTGIIPPTSGRVLIDGVPLARNNNYSWLRKIGYVPQNPYLLDASFAENIALSRWGEPVDRERVLRCCSMASLDFLDQLEDGIDTVLGERGVRLSGGQIQRTAIARALYSEPRLIIFDEATSSLDIKNEKTIYNTILSLRTEVAVVVIAHRLSTVEDCDVIVWMEDGKKKMEGVPEEVLRFYNQRIAQKL